MSLLAHYAAMRSAALAKIALGEVELDPLLDDPHDTRRGITLLARPPAPVAERILELLAEFRLLEPAQYYYPATDLHLTVLSLISCHPGFRLVDIEPAAYQALVAEVLHGVRPFRVELRGLTASPGGILLQGFPQGTGLQQLRTALRQAFQASGLRQTIDQRYRIQTAHATVVRFRAPLQHPPRLAELTRRFQDYPLGAFEVSTLELVYNDWYQRAAHTVQLGRYQLGAAAP